jgi:hypothetical protein
MNVTDLYTGRIQKSFDEDQIEIVSILKGKPNQVLKLINYYNGLPFSYAATVVAIERGAVDLDVRAEQAFAIEKSRSTFIRSPIFKYDVFARAQYVNIKKMVASFVKFSYVEIMAERRNFIRIAPEPHTEALIKSALGTFEGDVYDLSLSGLNILVHSSCPLELDAETTVSFMLSNVDPPIAVQIVVPAKLIAIKGDTLPREYKFIIMPDKTVERHLSQYIFKRQVEIIKEVKSAII